MDANTAIANYGMARRLLGALSGRAVELGRERDRRNHVIHRVLSQWPYVRVFGVEGALYKRYAETAVAQTIVEHLGADYVVPPNSAEDYLAREIVRKWDRAGGSSFVDEWRAVLPFPEMFVTLDQNPGEGLALMATQSMGRMCALAGAGGAGPDFDERLEHAAAGVLAGEHVSVLGWYVDAELIVELGYMHTAAERAKTGKPSGYSHTTFLDEAGSRRWSGVTGAHQVLPKLLTYIGDREAVTRVNTSVTRRAFKRAATHRQARPKPLYVVQVVDHVVDRTLAPLIKEAPQERSEPTHRYDVARHLRVLVRYGRQVDKADERMKLAKRGYWVFNGTVPPSVAKLLKDRGRRLASITGWVAVRLVYVKAHVRGPEDAPYVPALRSVK